MRNATSTLRSTLALALVALVLFAVSGCNVGVDACPGGARVNVSGAGGSGGMVIGPGGFSGRLNVPGANVAVDAGAGGARVGVHTRGANVDINAMGSPGMFRVANPSVDVASLRRQNPVYPYGPEEQLSNQQMLDYINQARDQKGLPPVALDDRLADEARRRSEELAQLPIAGWQQDEQMQGVPMGGDAGERSTPAVCEARFPYRSISPVEVPGLGSCQASSPQELAKVFFDGYASREGARLFDPAVRRVGINTTIIGDQRFAANALCFAMP